MYIVYCDMTSPHLFSFHAPDLRYYVLNLYFSGNTFRGCLDLKMGFQTLYFLVAWSIVRAGCVFIVGEMC